MSDQAKSVYMENDKRILETKIKPLITKELIEEHKRNPIGHHSKELDIVLNFLRRHHEEIKDKDLIICTEPHKKWCLGQHPGKRGVPYKIFMDECYDSREAAEHALFIKRLKKFGLWDEKKFGKGDES
jgi:branched-chain amino acid transport system permease protein